MRNGQVLNGQDSSEEGHFRVTPTGRYVHDATEFRHNSTHTREEAGVFKVYEFVYICCARPPKVRQSARGQSQNFTNFNNLKLIFDPHLRTILSQQPRGLQRVSSGRRQVRVRGRERAREEDGQRAVSHPRRGWATFSWPFIYRPLILEIFRWHMHHIFAHLPSRRLWTWRRGWCRCWLLSGIRFSTQRSLTVIKILWGQ